MVTDPSSGLADTQLSTAFDRRAFVDVNRIS